MKMLTLKDLKSRCVSLHLRFMKAFVFLGGMSSLQNQLDAYEILKSFFVVLRSTEKN